MHATYHACMLLQVFRIITANFADVDPGLLASLHDTPWTMIKLAHTARKQGLTEVCLNSLGKLYSVATMDVQVYVICSSMFCLAFASFPLDLRLALVSRVL